MLWSVAGMSAAASLQDPRRGGDTQTGKSLAPSKAAPHAEKPKPVAFLVNGFTGCCIPKKVKKFLEERGARVYVANWNDLERKRDHLPD